MIVMEQIPVPADKHGTSDTWKLYSFNYCNRNRWKHIGFTRFENVRVLYGTDSLSERLPHIYLLLQLIVQPQHSTGTSITCNSDIYNSFFPDPAFLYLRQW
jgi:hypothetical protein